MTNYRKAFSNLILPGFVSDTAMTNFKRLLIVGRCIDSEKGLLNALAETQVESHTTSDLANKITLCTTANQSTMNDKQFKLSVWRPAS